MEHRMIDVGGIRLHAVVEGDGPETVLLLHGFPECWYSWRHQIPALAAAGLRVVAPDLRGYNLSDKPTGLAAYRGRALVEDVAGIARSLGLSRLHVVGHDWGGAVAWMAATYLPGLVSRLAILNCPHPAIMVRRLWRPAQLRRSWYMFAFQIPGFAERKIVERSFFEKALRGMSANPAAFTDEDIDLFHRAMQQPGAATATLAYYRAAFRWPMLRADPVRCPTLLVWGDLDRALGQELIPGTERYAPELQVEHVPDASHWVQQDRPQRVSDLLIRFLAPA